jgi:pimeloyl-ACP methyl ester carboxylesterase
MTQTSTTPSDYPPGAGPLPEIPGVEVEHEFYDLPGGRFHVARAGDRSLPAVLLVHGFPQHWYGWRGVIAELSKEAHLIVPDLRGAGWSSLPTGPNAAKKRELAGDLRGLLDAMGIEKIAIASHDWGGFASQILTLETPERVTRLLALSIPPIPPTPRPPVRSMLRMYYQLVFAAPFSDKLMAKNPKRFAHGLRQDVQQREAFTRDDAMVFALPYTTPARAKLAQQTYRSFLKGDAASIFGWARGKKFQVPVRFVLSKFDAYIPPEFAEHASRTGEHVESILQDRTGHFLPDEDPTYTADQIREWLLPTAVPVA